ncbi:MAG: site-2 protease family protein [Opitutales bacterium]|nr:site-2 protease family protein [Opitutales bacterium]
MLGTFEDRIIFYIILLIGITMHEFGHAYAADKLGDPLPRAMGRVTLNPLAHADKVGTFILPLVMIFTGAPILFGWGKPVYVSLPNPKTRMRDDLISTACGPLANLVLALIATFIFSAAYVYKLQSLQDVAIIAMLVNCMLFVFNMLPIPPLDGSHFLRYVLKVSNETYAKIERNGFWILLVIILLPATNNILGYLIDLALKGLLCAANFFVIIIQRIA